MIDKPTIGDMVFVSYGGDRPEAAQAAVTKVGRKYFEVKANSYWPLEFDMETNHAGYWTSSTRSRHSRICYRNEDALAAKKHDERLEIEARELRDLIGKAFEHWNRTKYTLDQLRRVKAIVDEVNPQPSPRNGRN